MRAAAGGLEGDRTCKRLEQKGRDLVGRGHDAGGIGGDLVVAVLVGVVPQEERQRRKGAAGSAVGIVDEDGDAVGLGPEGRDGPQHAGAGRGLDGGGGRLDGGPVDAAHAGEDVGRNRTVHRSHDRVPVGLLDGDGVGREAQGVAGVGNEAGGDGVFA